MPRPLFQLNERRTTLRTEVLGGITTFATMAYIIVVQPAVLSGEMFGTETGTRVMKRIAAPMVGGLVSSTLLTLVVLPAIYLLWKKLQLRDLFGKAG